MKAVASLEMAALTEREGLRRHGLRLRWTDRLVAEIASRGYDPRLGARPLQRTVEQMVVTPLARFLVGRQSSRPASLLLDMETDGELRIRG